MYEVRVARSINEIAEKEWDSLLPEKAGNCYGWVKTVEETRRGDWEPRYVLLYREGKPVGAAACSITRFSSEIYTPNDALLGRFGRYTKNVGVSFLPAFTCPVVSDLGPVFFLDRNLPEPERRAATERMVEAIEEEAHREGISVLFRNLGPEDGVLQEVLERKDYSSTISSPICYLEVEWSSFEGYLQYVRRTVGGETRRQIRQEIRRNIRAGVEVRVLRADEIQAHEKRIYDLFYLNYHRHNGMPYPYREDLLPRVRANLGERAEVFIAVKEGVVVGGTFQIRNGNSVVLPAIGVDHERTGNDFTYFRLAYYEPIRHAIRSGIRYMYYGNAVYQAKIRRGCRAVPLRVFHKSRSRLRNLAVRPYFAFHKWWWYKRKFPPILKEHLAGTSEGAGKGISAHEKCPSGRA